ncbi:unnamed protein product [Phytophthora fragariaefolia]|uniref:Unnamed protein product n=1 Tax=Phytophthora fragariaefolia TaxID=1490495 RepID=A0A9W6XD06_9STRA|nr:unnamed protein product [Phytophthora fragariaefolia]
MVNTQRNSIVLEKKIGATYELTEKGTLEHAEALGMDLETKHDLFWIAREGMKVIISLMVVLIAPTSSALIKSRRIARTQDLLPENCKPFRTSDTKEICYFNLATGRRIWEHPADEV